MDDQRVRAVIGALAGLGALAVLSAIPGWWWVTVFALAAMIGGVGLIIVDINVQLRQHRSDFLKATARLQTPAKPETAAMGKPCTRLASSPPMAVSPDPSQCPTGKLAAGAGQPAGNALAGRPSSSRV